VTHYEAQVLYITLFYLHIMEIRKITRTDKDGKRLFIEIGKNMKKEDVLPALKKGDELLLMPIRKLTIKQMERLIGKYVKFFDISEEDSYALCFEGVIKKNNPEFWEDDDGEDIKKNKYVLIDPEIGPIDFFDDLNDIFDLQVIPGRERFVDKVNCLKCKKQFLEAYKYCPHCGNYNKLYREGLTNGNNLHK